MKKVATMLLSVCMILTLLAACAGDASSAPAASSQPAEATQSQAESTAPQAGGDGEFKGTVKIGVLAPITGSLAEFGIGFDAATKMAVEEINANGGANGYKLELVINDSQSDPTVSSTLARQYADDEEIMAILGDYSSSCCMANAPIVEAGGIVQLSPSASSPDYAVMSPYCFSTVGRQDIEAPFFSTYVMQKYLGAQRISVIRVNSDFGAATYKNFLAQAEKDGLEIVTDDTFVDGETDFSSIMTKIRVADPDAVLIIASGDVPKIINQMAQNGLQDVKIGVLGTGTSEQIIELCGENAEGVVTSTPFFFDKENPELMAWLDEFVSIAGFVPSMHPPTMRDNVYLIKQCIEEIGDEEITREKIKDHLTNIEMEGLTGLIKFDENGTVPRDYYIFGVENGEWVEKAGLDYSKQ